MAARVSAFTRAAHSARLMMRASSRTRNTLDHDRNAVIARHPERVGHRLAPRCVQPAARSRDAPDLIAFAGHHAHLGECAALRRMLAATTRKWDDRAHGLN